MKNGKPLRATILVLAGLALGVLLLLASGGISLLQPTPFWLLFLYYFSDLIDLNVYYAGAMLLAALFIAWNKQLIRGQGRIPRRSVILFAALALGSGIYIISRFPFMAEIDALGYYSAICLINAAIAAVLVFLLRRGRKEPSFTGSLVFHWVLFAWPATYGFAWMFEAL